MLSDTERQQSRTALKAATAGKHVREALEHARTLLTSGKSADYNFCSTAFGSITPELIACGHKQLKTFLVRSITVEPTLPFLATEAVLAGYVLDMQVGGYGSYVDELLRPESELGLAQPDLVCVLLDLEDFAGTLPDLCAGGLAQAVEAEIEAAVARFGQMLQSYRSRSSSRLVLQGMVVPAMSSLGLAGDANQKHSLPNSVKDLNRRLAGLCAGIPDCVFFDIDQIAAQFGRERWSDPRMFLASRVPMSSAAFPAFAHGLIRTASVLFRAPRKVLCTDLDNTLWGGIVGEDGPLGIATGSAFPGNCFLAYQRYLKQLASRGILLAIVSKNNEADVEEAFQLRAADLGLALHDFVAHKISWGEKTEALRALARELNLGLDSFVFVDDNPVECEAVRRNLPDVAVITAPANEPWKLPQLLSEHAYFDTATVTADDLNRATDYKAQAQREALSLTAGTRDEFLQSLGIVCTFVSAMDAPLARSVQLLAKTNQFNLTTRRHSAVEVEQFASSPGGLAVAVRVRDRFGDAGVVGLALVRQEQDCCLIDSFLLSCRVIGRGIETALLAHVAQHAASAGCRWIIGEYVETKKNSLCSGFYPDHGFERDTTKNEQNSVFYQRNISEHLTASPPWLTLEGSNHEFASTTRISS